jgi:hypothetical protein
MSMFNSAFLVLYHQCRRDFAGPGFDEARAFLRKEVRDELRNSDWERIQDMAGFTLVFERAKVAQQAAITIQDLRRLHDPHLDAGDGVLDHFPARSVSEENGTVVVTLPYSRSLRGKVKFPLTSSSFR